MSGVFDDWNKGELGSFLIEITRDILGMVWYGMVWYVYDSFHVSGFVDESGEALVEKIRDTAGQVRSDDVKTTHSIPYTIPYYAEGNG